MNEVIVELKSFQDLEKLQDSSYFINNWRYPKDEICAENEFGKIEFYDLTLRFHVQPERSKREDFAKEKDKIDKSLSKAFHGCLDQEYYDLLWEVCEFAKMRCSELYGNIETLAEKTRAPVVR